jgi:hypothetical protein
MGSAAYVFVFIFLLYMLRIAATLFLAAKGAHHVAAGAGISSLLGEAQRVERREDLLVEGDGATIEKNGVLDQMFLLANLRIKGTKETGATDLDAKLSLCSEILADADSRIESAMADERALAADGRGEESSPRSQRRFIILHGFVLFVLVAVLATYFLL